MTTTTPPAKNAAGPRRAAFTLAEVIIAASLSTLVLAAVLSTFLFLARTGFNTAAYAEMSSALRIGIERFHRDARLASDLRWHDHQRLTLLIPSGENGALENVTYGYAPETPAQGVFYRETIQQDSPVRTILARGVAPDFSFRRYSIAENENAQAPAANDLETKLVEVSLRAVRRGANGAPVTHDALSTRCLLRNKSVAQ
jgi:hypothetical protein